MFYINNIKIIRFTGMIPKHAFLSWLVALDRLSTRDRMRRWGITVSPLCLLCGSTDECRQHLFFDCPYSQEVWEFFYSRLHLSPPHLFEDGLRWISSPLRIIISTSSFVSPFKLLSTCYGRRGTQGFTPRSLDLLLFLLLRFSVWFAQNWTHYRGLSDIDHRLSPSFLPGSRSFRLQRLCCFVFLFCFVMLTINK